jgi:hypothetical protein
MNLGGILKIKKKSLSEIPTILQNLQIVIPLLLFYSIYL